MWINLKRLIRYRQFIEFKDKSCYNYKSIQNGIQGDILKQNYMIKSLCITKIIKTHLGSFSCCHFYQKKNKRITKNKTSDMKANASQSADLFGLHQFYLLFTNVYCTQIQQNSTLIVCRITTVCIIIIFICITY